MRGNLPWSLPCFIYGAFMIGMPIAALAYWSERSAVACWSIMVLGVVISAIGAWRVRAETGIWWPR